MFDVYDVVAVCTREDGCPSPMLQTSQEDLWGPRARGGRGSLADSGAVGGGLAILINIPRSHIQSWYQIPQRCIKVQNYWGLSHIQSYGSFRNFKLCLRVLRMLQSFLRFNVGRTRFMVLRCPELCAVSVSYHDIDALRYYTTAAMELQMQTHLGYVSVVQIWVQFWGSWYAVPYFQGSVLRPDDRKMKQVLQALSYESPILLCGGTTITRETETCTRTQRLRDVCNLAFVLSD